MSGPSSTNQRTHITACMCTFNLSFVLRHPVYDVALVDISVVVLDMSHRTAVVKFYHCKLWLGSFLAVFHPWSFVVDSISNFDSLGHVGLLCCGVLSFIVLLYTTSKMLALDT